MLLQERQELAVEHVLDQQAGVGVRLGLCEDQRVIQEPPAERLDRLDVDIFDNLRQHDEAELVTRKLHLVLDEGLQ